MLLSRPLDSTRLDSGYYILLLPHSVFVDFTPSPPPVYYLPLREAKVIAALSNGFDDLRAQNVVAIIFGEIELCTMEVSIYQIFVKRGENGK